MDLKLIVNIPSITQGSSATSTVNDNADIHSTSLKPRMNLHEDSRKNLVTATIELPGLSKNEVNIDVYDGSLTVSGVITESSGEEEHLYVVRERWSGRFSRTIKLPDGTDPKEVRASMKHGVLTVNFTQKPPGIEPQRITIR